MDAPLSSMSFDELLRPEGHLCTCGRHHSCGVKYLRVGHGVSALLP